MKISYNKDSLTDEQIKNLRLTIKFEITKNIINTKYNSSGMIHVINKLHCSAASYSKTKESRSFINHTT